MVASYSYPVKCFGDNVPIKKTATKEDIDIKAKITGQTLETIVMYAIKKAIQLMSDMIVKITKVVVANGVGSIISV